MKIFGIRYTATGILYTQAYSLLCKVFIDSSSFFFKHMRNAPKDPEFSSSAMVRSHTENYNWPNKEPISFIITHLIFSFVMISLADKEEGWLSIHLGGAWRQWLCHDWLMCVRTILRYQNS